MKKTTLLAFMILSLFAVIATNPARAQDTTKQKKIYASVGGEVIFSWADAKSNGMDATSITRFAPCFNFQNQVHFDVNKTFGFFSGLNLRNLGFIYDDPATTSTRYKLRTYTLGLPLAIKVGNMKRTYFFGGYELELPICFKEKKFVNDDKVNKSSDWFSPKTPGIYQSVFAGIHGPYGVELKFKYYLTNFVDQDYAANDGNGNIIYPYQNFEANVFYISLSFQLRNTHLAAN